MLLRYLKLDNFLSHQDEEISFPAEGIYLLAGDSGIGKSSLIIDATAYALFGPAAVTRARRRDEIINEHAAGSGMQVKAVFQFEDSETVAIERGISASGHVFARVYKNDDQGEPVAVADGPKASGRYISRKLGGMNWQQFFAAFVARQNEISMLTEMRGSERKNLIHRMLGMRELEKAGELAADRIRRSKAEVDHLVRSIGGFDPEQVEAEIALMESRVEDEEQKLTEALGKQQKLEKQKPDLEQEVSELKQQVAAAEELPGAQQLLTHSEGERQRLETAVAQHHEATRQLLTYEQKSQQHTAVSEEVRDLREVFTRSEAVAKKEAALEQRRSETVASEHDPAQLKEEKAALAALVTAQEKALLVKKQEISTLRSSGECYVCERPFASEHDHVQVLADLDGKCRQAEEEIQAGKERISTITALIPAAEKSMTEQAALVLAEEVLASLRAEGRCESDLQALIAQGKESKEHERVLQSELAEMDVLRRDLDPGAEQKLSTAQASEEEAKSRVRLLSEQQASSKQRDHYLEQEQLLTEVNSQLLLLQALIPEMKNNLDKSQTELQRNQDSLEGRRGELLALAGLRAKSKVAEQVGVYLKGFQRHLADEIRPSLEAIGSEMLATISGGSQVKMMIDDDYEITVETSEGSIRRASMLSGGEQIRANICLRLALTRLVSQRTGVPVGFLIFDEPLPSQDPGHIQRIMGLLHSLKPFYQQQFLISHVGDLRSADELDYVIEFREQRPRVMIANA